MTTKITTAIVLLIACATIALAQAPAPPAAPKSLAATLNVYVFPTAGQTPEQQSIDEGTCYNWAVQSTGNDPFALQKQAQQQQQQTQQAQQQAQQVGQGVSPDLVTNSGRKKALIHRNT